MWITIYGKHQKVFNNKIKNNFISEQKKNLTTIKFYRPLDNYTPGNPHYHG